jgi:hypothetical protein
MQFLQSQIFMFTSGLVIKRVKHVKVLLRNNVCPAKGYICKLLMEVVKLVNQVFMMLENNVDHVRYIAKNVK